MFSLDFTSSKDDFLGTCGADGQFRLITPEEGALWRLDAGICAHVANDYPVLHLARSNVIFVLALPPAMSPEEIFSASVGLGAAPKNLQVVRGEFLSAILEFESQTDADTFYVNSLGEPINSACPFVRYISLFLASVSPDIGIVPVLTREASVNREMELPMCPVCFERFDPLISSFFSMVPLDDVSAAAVEAWGGTKCCVCMSKVHKCGECGECSDTWICMECGHVGCGRLQGLHAVDHFTATNHRFALHRESSRIWDYVRDEFANRSFHARSSLAGETAVARYRDTLLQRMAEQRQVDGDAMAALVLEMGSKSEELEAQILQAEEDEAELAAEYERCLPLVEECARLRAELDSIDTRSKLVEKMRLETEMEDLIRQRDETNERIVRMECIMNGCPDISSQVNIVLEE